MANPYNKRSGLKHRKDFLQGLKSDANKLSGSSTATARAIGEAIYFDNGVTLETVETHLVPRKSLTDRQFLKIHSQDVIESVDQPFKIARKLPHGKSQVETMTGEFISGSDERVLRMSDKNLLRRSNPFAVAKDTKRRASRSKAITSDVKTGLFELPNSPLAQLAKSMNQGVDETELDQPVRQVVRRIK